MLFRPAVLNTNELDSVDCCNFNTGGTEAVESSKFDDVLAGWADGCGWLVVERADVF